MLRTVEGTVYAKEPWRNEVNGLYKDQIAGFIPTCEQERSDKSKIYHFMQDYPHNILTRDNGIAHLTSSGFIMNRDLTRALIIYHKIYNAWGWTGGHADGDQDLLAIALKEAREETGLKRLTPLSRHILSLDILPVWGHVKNGSYVSAHLHLNASYVLIAEEEDPLILNEDETGGIQWIEADRIGDYSTEPDLVVIYKKLIEAARAYDPSKERPLVPVDEAHKEAGFRKAVSDAGINIAVHEAKSTYYKAKLLKEFTVHTSKGLKGLFSKK